MDASSAFSLDQLDTSLLVDHKNISHIVQISEENPAHKQAWKKAYNQRKKDWKWKATADLSVPVLTEGALYDGSICHIVDVTSVNEDAVIQKGLYKQAEADKVDINEFLLQYTPRLNMEQERAFKIIASHSQQKQSAPLHMYLGGQGGTGKSHVISALKNFRSAATNKTI
ncbi:hypothetical protein EV368DRAFT_53048 [Lentinula lateritia]|nr:hypothetical protein EV368DRAFT_53048 [Lentinula lateritia]